MHLHRFASYVKSSVVIPDSFVVTLAIYFLESKLYVKYATVWDSMSSKLCAKDRTCLYKLLKVVCKLAVL